MKLTLKQFETFIGMKNTYHDLNPRSKRTTPTLYGPSQTIPGQSLTPSELLKRHLAGTLPPIDLSSKFEYHYDEKGNQVAEPLPLELHEVHKLSVAIRKRQYEESLIAKQKAAEKHKNEIIAEYEKNNPKLHPLPKSLKKTETPGPDKSAIKKGPKSTL